MNTKVYDVIDGEYVFSFDAGDTAIMFTNVTGIAGNSWDYYMTSRAASGISKRKLGLSPNYTQTRDLLGRSRSGKSASQILIDVSDDKGAARRRIEH